MEITLYLHALAQPDHFQKQNELSLASAVVNNGIFNASQIDLLSIQ